MAAAATGQLRLLQALPDLPEADQEGLLCLVHGRIKRCLYALAVVLVTSTVAASIFFHLPSQMLAGRSADIAKRYSHFAGELSIFWGAVYTLTLIAAVGVPLLLVQHKLRLYLDGLKPPDAAVAVHNRLAGMGVTGKAAEQFKLILTMLAPLATGPVANFLQSAAK